MKHTELAYAAGYLDGEGCFLFSKGTPCVRIENTYIHTLVWFSEIFGGRVRSKASFDNPNWRQAHVWEIYGDTARNCLNKVIPYLKEKLPQAKILLEISAYPPRSHKRDQLVRELRALKRISYEWNHSNTTQVQHSSAKSSDDSMTQSSSHPQE